MVEVYLFKYKLDAPASEYLRREYLRREYLRREHLRQFIAKLTHLLALRACIETGAFPYLNK